MFHPPALPRTHYHGYDDQRLSINNMPIVDIDANHNVAALVKRTYRQLKNIWQRHFLIFLLKILVYEWQKEMSHHMNDFSLLLCLPENLAKMLHEQFIELSADDVRNILNLFIEQFQCIQRELEDQPGNTFRLSLSLLECMVELCKILHQKFSGKQPISAVNDLLKHCHTSIMSRGNRTPPFPEFYRRLSGGFTKMLPIEAHK